MAISFMSSSDFLNYVMGLGDLSVSQLGFFELMIQNVSSSPPPVSWSQLDVVATTLDIPSSDLHDVYLALQSLSPYELQLCSESIDNMISHSEPEISGVPISRFKLHK